MATATVTPIVPTKSKLLMDECQRLAASRLPEILKEVLTQADDVLFKFANGADNSRRQNLFFDAMREALRRRIWNRIAPARATMIGRGRSPEHA